MMAGLMTGFIANLLIFSWIWKTFHAAQIGFITTLNAWVMLSFILGIYTGLFFLFYGLLPEGYLRPIGAGIIWVVLDHIRTLIMTGFPWALISHTQATHLNLIQLASVTGASGITFLIVGVNAALAELIHMARDNKFLWNRMISISLIPLITGLAFLWGYFRVHTTDPEPFFLKVAILQGNIDQYQKWDKSYEVLIKERYESLIETASKYYPNVIVWPESATPGWLPGDSETTKWVTSLVQKSGTNNIVGSVSARGGKEFNSAFLFTSNGNIKNIYDKRHLVPFGESIPFGGFLSRWIPYLGNLGTFDSGGRYEEFIINTSKTGEVRFSPNICYEAIFPSLVRRSLTPQTNFIVNLTNDGWFLDTGAPEQHFVTNIFRAVENGRPVIRAANTGISGIINSNGRTLIRSQLLTTDVLMANVPFQKDPPQTFYARWGHWFEILCWVGFLGLFARLIWGKFLLERLS